MPVCSFKSCLTGSKSKNTVRISSNPVLHRFPKDPYMRSIWQEQAQRGFEKSSINFKSAVICSLHFVPYHYLNNIQIILIITMYLSTEVQLQRIVPPIIKRKS
ncbi:THAP-type domain-containing protein [Aphis craccivora]|uniref:THAP-type domain-containing protein n=1 Tax=Aphis craccivora TaxID=307492 RepID=A0A6G0Y449_APHCR|nr:THAP-type domain-containing protein [Aphis craccivora]